MNLKHAKFWIGLLGLAVMVAGWAPEGHALTETVDGIAWTYTVSGGKASVGGGDWDKPAIPKSTSGAITIPPALGGYPVTGIGDYAFRGCSGLTSVTIPDSVANIGHGVFINCSGLTGFKVGAGNPVCASANGLLLSKDGKTVLSGVNGVVTIPGTVTKIMDSAFYGYSGLTGITIPDSVTSIGDCAFTGSGLTDVTVPESVTDIGGGVFWECGKLTNATVWCHLASSYSYGRSIFEECSNLETVSLGKKVETIQEGMFSNCGKLKNVTISDSVTSIAESAFSNCAGLETITIPESVTSIGYGAFSGCAGLTNVTIPDSMASIGREAFGGCNNALFDQTAIPGAKLVDGWAVQSTNALAGHLDLADIRGIADYAFYNCSNLTGVTIGNRVTGIGNYAFYNCHGLSEVAIPNSVTDIGIYAFYDCYGLSEVAIPNSVTDIGAYAFDGCTGLTNATIPDGVASIGSRAFAWCAGLADITIPDSVTDIGYGAFLGCKGLKSVTIPQVVCTNQLALVFSNACTSIADVFISDGVTNIGYKTFSGCNGLTNVTIGKNVTDIGYQAFSGCTGLTDLVFPGSMTSIGYGAFSGCTGLTNVVIPGSVTGIGYGAFSGCSGVTGVTIPQIVCDNQLSNVFPSACTSIADVTIADGVTNIPSRAFSGCTGLTGVTIPDSVTRIGSQAFSGCNAALFDGTSIPGVQLVDGWAVSSTNALAGHLDLTGIRGLADGVFSGCSGLAGATIPDTVAGIGENAFYGCTGLTSLSIPDSVTHIGENAFYGCTGLANLSIPDSVTHIGGGAFERCSGLASISIPDSATSIGYRAFSGCTGLTDITIPDSVTSLGEYAFAGCTGLTDITVPDNVTDIGNSAFSGCTGLSSVKILGNVTNDYTYYYSYSHYGPFFGCTNLETVVLGPQVAKIGNYMFANLDTLADIAIPDSVTSIGDHAFRECNGLTNATIPDSVTNIGNSAFSWCAGLTNLTIGNGVTSVGSGAFAGCGGLTNVWIPDSVTGSLYAFSSCSNLISVTIGNGVTDLGGFSGCTSLKSVTIPDGVTNIGNYAFSGCTGLTEVAIPDSVTHIGEGAFSGCTGLMGVVIGSSVAGIGDNAFSECTELTDVALPDSVTNIAASAFNRCSNLVAVSVGNGNPAYASDDGVLFSRDMGTLLFCPYAKAGPYGIPEGVGNIGPSAFSGCTGLTEVAIPDSVTNIGYSAFSGCTRLTNVKIPDNVNNIGWGAFSGCTGLASVTIPTGVTDIWSSTFSGCTGLASVTIPDGVANIGSEAFRNCSNLVRVAIGNGVTNVGRYAFSGCTGLEEIHIASVEAWCGVSFERYYWDDSHPLSRPHRLFLNGEEVFDLVIPDGVGTIGNYAFDGCAGLTSVAIPDSVTNIGSASFRLCQNLERVAIGAGVTNFESSTFQHCPALSEIAVAESNQAYATENGVLFSRDLKTLVFCPNGQTGTYTVPADVTDIAQNAFLSCGKLVAVSIPGSVTNVGDGVFSGCTNLASVKIPDSVASIGNSAFYGCSGLKWIRVPASWEGTSMLSNAGVPSGCTVLCGAESDIVDGAEWLYVATNGEATVVVAPAAGSLEVPAKLGGRTVTAIARSAFSAGGVLERVAIPAGVTNIADYAFYNCTNLSVLAIGAGVTNIVSSMFYNCTALSEISVSGDNPAYASENGVLFDGGMETLLFCPYAKPGLYAVPDGVRAIAQYAFQYCRELAAVAIPDSVESIGNSAFYGCSGLKWIRVPASWEGTSMLSNARVPSGCTVLYGAESEIVDGAEWLYVATNGEATVVGAPAAGNLEVPAKLGGRTVTAIAGTAFSASGGLERVAIGAGVTNIADYAFSHCTNLVAISVAQGNPAYASDGGVLFDGGMETLLFCPYAKPGSYAVPDGVRAIAQYAFQSCRELEGATVPGTVTNIASYAFYNCTNLSALAIGAGVTNIGSSMFYNCTALSEISVADGNPAYASENGILFSRGMETLVWCPSGKNGTYAVPDGVTDIGPYAFYNCTSLTGVTIPDTVTIIGNYAFGYCSGLTELMVPAGVASIGWYAFYGCAGLKTLCVPEEWEGTGLLANAGVPAGCEVVYGTYAETDAEGNGTLSKDGVDWIFRMEDGKAVLTSVRGASTCLTVPSHICVKGHGKIPVARIAGGAFATCGNLTAVVIPDGVEAVAPGAFRECAALARILAPVEWAGTGTLDGVESPAGCEIAHCVHSGTLSASQTWAAETLHVVAGKLAVPSGVTLAIEAGTVVKFAPGATLAVASGGACTANGAIFTHLYDDTAGGDTSADGDATTPKMADYAVTGSVTDDDTTEWRYTAPVKLSGTVSSYTRWRGNKVYHVTGNLTVASGATLTVAPGAIVKFASGCSLTVNSGGTLDALGTRAAPIVFTSVKDDEHGGDTNGDGDATYVQPGDWHQISGSGTVNMDHCQVLWCSAQNNQGALYPNGGTWTFNNSTVAHCEYDCMRSYGGTFSATNSVFTDSSMGAAPAGGTARFVNCVFYDLTTAVRWSCGSFVNCIFSRIAKDILDPSMSGTASQFRNCCFWSPEASGDKASSKIGQDGNVYADPLFVDPDNGDFRLSSAASPCVDAADSTQAPATDAFGSPRMDAKAVPDTGIPNEEGVCADIGIHELPGATPMPLPDLAVLSVAAPATARAGGEITVSYVVTNCGAGPAAGLVRDTFRFQGAEEALGGFAADAGEVQQAYDLASGASATMTAHLSVPAAKPGAWKLGIEVNPFHDVYERNLSNNRALAENPTGIEMQALPAGRSSVPLQPGEPAGFVLSGLPVAGGVARIAGAPGFLAAHGGNGAVPSGEASSCATVPLDDGSLLVVFPARAEGENAYLVLENAGSAAAEVSVEVEAPGIALYAATPARIVNSGEATLVVTGSGLDAGTAVALGGRKAKSVEVLDAARIAATFAVDGMATGKVSVAATAPGTGSASLPDAVEIHAAKTGPKLKAWLEMPPSVRDGRTFTGYVCYENEGDSPMAMPVFKVAGEDSSAKMGLSAGETLPGTVLYIGGISPTHPAGVLKAGDSGRIPFFFQPFGSYAIKLTHVKDGEDATAFPAFGGTKAYLAAMAAAATRLNLRGKAHWNILDFVDQALWERSGVPCAAVSGHLVDAKTREPMAGIGISAVAADPAAGLAPSTATTDRDGYFSLAGLADGEYRFLLEDGAMLAGAGTGTVVVASQADINGITVHATRGGRISGFVTTGNGEPIANATVTVGNDTGLSLDAGTDGSGFYSVDGLADGVYSVAAMSHGLHVGQVATNVAISAVERSVSLDFALAEGGAVSGRVRSGGVPVTNGCVRAIARDGTESTVACAADGTYRIEGLPPGNYQLQYYSATRAAEGGIAAIAAGTELSRDLAAEERPLFEPLRHFGFGNLETAFFFTDRERAANVTAWAWDFDSDGAIDSTEPSPSWTYAGIGTYTVTLTITENGATTTSVYPDCIVVEPETETVYSENAIAFGANSGNLAVVSLSDGGIVLSGTPPKELVPGRVLAGAFEGEGFIRRIVSVEGDESGWRAETENGTLDDVFDSIGVSCLLPLEMREEDGVRAKSPAKSAARADDGGEGGSGGEGESGGEDGSGGKRRFHVFIDGGLSFEYECTPNLYQEFSYRRKFGHTYMRTAIVGSLDAKETFTASVEAGLRYELKKDIEVTQVPLVMAGPVPICTIAPEFFFGVFVQISGKLESKSEFIQHIRYLHGFEQKDDEFTWLKPFDTSLGGETTAEFGGKGTMGVKLGAGAKVRALGIFSAELGPALTLTASYSEGTETPAKFDATLKVGITGALNYFDVNIGWFQAKHGVSGFWGLSYEIFSYTGAKPDFTWYPSRGDAPLLVDFASTSEGEIKRWPGHENTYPVAGYKWSGEGIEGATTPEVSHTFESEGRYPVTLEVRGKHLNGVLSRQAKKHVVVGNPEDIPDDGEEEPDDREQDSSKQSCDPNEMVGPLGTGSTRAMAAGEWATYTIYFENKADATADAQQVVVDAALSPQLDWSSFEMLDVAFGSLVDTGLAGRKNGTSSVDFGTDGRQVKTTVAFDAKTGAVSWTLRIWDPDGLFGWPNDGSGFLPPNDETHRGEGHITYRVKVKENATEGARIDAAATIVFDYNEPIPTDPAWWNTVAYRTYAVKFNANGGTGTMANQRIKRDTATKLRANAFKKSGFTFLGWSKSKTGAVAYKNAASVKNLAAAGGSATLYAQWAKNAYKVAFNANGGSLPKGKTMAAQAMTYGKAAKLRKNAFTRKDCTFMGWATAKTGKVAYANQASVKNLRTDGKTTTLYARWAKTKYAVAFNANGGTGKMANQAMTYNKAAKLAKNAFKRSGWTFLGWATSKNGKVVYKNAAEVKNLRTDGKTTTLYAKWAKNSYKVAFNANGGTGTMTAQAMTYGKAANLRKNAFKRTGYTFAGWAKTKTGAVAYKNAASVKNLRADGGTQTLFAKWTATTYKVAFNANGGTGTMAAQSVKYDATAKLRANAFTREGYTFAGWSKTKTGAVAYKNTASVKNLRSDGGTTTLYAVWTENPKAETSSGVPYAWLKEKAAGILSANGGDYEAAAKAKAANGVNTVWECYVAGLDPTDETAAFTAALSFDGDGNPVVSSDPDLGVERAYTVEGVENLGDAWGPTNAATRFFRVKVMLRGGEADAQ